MENLQSTAESERTRVLTAGGRYEEVRAIAKASSDPIVGNSWFVLGSFQPGSSKEDAPKNRVVAESSPESDLDDVVWAADGRLSLAEARGSVVALILWNPEGSSVLDEEIQELDRLAKARSAEGLVAAALILHDFKKAPKEVSELALKAHQKLERLGVSIPCGVLPTERYRSFFPRSCRGTCVVLDRRGTFAWEAILGGTVGAHWSLTRLALARCLQ